MTLHSLKVRYPEIDREIVLYSLCKKCLDALYILVALDLGQLIIDPVRPKLLGKREERGHALVRLPQALFETTLAEERDVLWRGKSTGGEGAVGSSWRRFQSTRGVSTICGARLPKHDEASPDSYLDVLVVEVWIG